MFITLADFDSRWGVYAGGNDGNKKKGISVTMVGELDLPGKTGITFCRHSRSSPKT